MNQNNNTPKKLTIKLLQEAYEKLKECEKKDRELLNKYTHQELAKLLRQEMPSTNKKGGINE